MKYTGYGTGRTQAEAEANARADAESKKSDAEALSALFQLIGMLTMAAMGYIMAISLMYYQFLIRPVATLVLAFGAYLVFMAFVLFMMLMEYLNWWPVTLLGGFAVIGMIIWGGVILMESRDDIIESLDSIEDWERGMLCRAPGWIRVPLVTLETLTPLIALVAISVLYFTSTHFAVEGTRFLWIYIVIALVTLLIQVIAFGKRVEASEAYGDFTVFGFRFAPR